MSWLGLDIGGANLKAADGLGWARSVPFPLWREAERLSAALAELLASSPACDRVAVTMTGELCDCFRTKTEGVRHIVEAVQEAANTIEALIYLVDGRLVSCEAAKQHPELAAASNWHILSRFAARFAGNEAAVLLDIGSTTTDIVPIDGGRVKADGVTDTDRLLAGELVYTGIGRTPICAVTRSLLWRGKSCPLAAEVFSTTADVYVMLQEIRERPDCFNTADGRPLTREFARERLARMFCADSTAFSEEDAMHAASQVRELQNAQIGQAITQVVGRMDCKPRSVVISGMGEFFGAQLARDWFIRAKVVFLSDEFGETASECGPAHALASLARDGTLSS